LRGTLAFVTAAKRGSFTKAAAELELSPQAVAASIARLEQALGARLFNRSTRSIALTEEGSMFFERAQIGLAALEDAARSIKDSGREPHGLVRVSSGAAFGRKYLLPLLPAFCKQYPQIRLDLTMDDRKIDLVNDGYDIAFRGGAIADSTLITRQICELGVILVASPQYLKKYGNPMTPNDLTKHRLIGLRFASGKTASWDFKIKGQSYAYEASEYQLQLSDSESVGQAAALGLGIARVSLHFAWPLLQAGKLKVVLNQFNDPGKRSMVIHYPHREHIAPRIKAYVDFCLAELKAEPSLQAKPQNLEIFAP
jgi:DNA-binding transcriptional LysR family regulator